MCWVSPVYQILLWNSGYKMIDNIKFFSYDQQNNQRGNTWSQNAVEDPIGACNHSLDRDWHLAWLQCMIRVFLKWVWVFQGNRMGGSEKGSPGRGNRICKYRDVKDWLHLVGLVRLEFIVYLYSLYCSVYTGEGNGNPLQYSCLGSPMNRGAWWAAVHGDCASQDPGVPHFAPKASQSVA